MTQSFAAPEASTGGAVGQRRQQIPPLGEVDRPPVVGVDQRVLPQLGALVDVGDARHGELDQLLAESVGPARLLDQREQPLPGIPQPGVVVGEVDRRLDGTPRTPRRPRSRRSPGWPPASPSPRTRAGVPAPRPARRRPGSGRGSRRRRGWGCRIAPGSRAAKRSHSWPTSASTASRARTSSPRLVSWVDSEVIDSGCRSWRTCCRAWKSSSPMPNSPASAPTSLSAMKRAYR